MANLVRLEGDQVSLPHLSLSYPIKPELSKLEEGLAAYRNLKEDISIQSLPQEKRREITRFMRQYGALLYRTIFPNGYSERLNNWDPLLLETGADWHSYPWEWMNDGKQWISLGPGLLRFVAKPAPLCPEPPPPELPLKVLAVSANPLPHTANGSLAQQESLLGTKFISTVGMLLDDTGGADSKYSFRSVEHASPASLENALTGSPHLMYYSGFSEEDGWYLESARFGAEKVGKEWLSAHIGKAVREGLRALVLNDSLGLLKPKAAAAQTASFFQTGLPALIRIDGRQARLREQDYLRALVRGMGEGLSLPSCHLAGIRRLFRRFEESWDWSFIRLHLRALPANENTPAEDSQPEILASKPGEAELFDPGAGKNSFAQPPPPPLYSRKRRVIGRGHDLEKLGKALDPMEEVASPLVFMSGPAGIGKTALAFEAARRIHRSFSQVIYLHPRDILPSPGPLAGALEFDPPAPPAREKLFSELARHFPALGRLHGSWEKWEESIKEHLATGPPRLIILDGLEHYPGYEGLCRAMEGFPPTCRILLISRGKPPLLSGKQINLQPVDEGELKKIIHSDLLKRINSSPIREDLLEVCSRDLLVARLLWRLPSWPGEERLAKALRENIESHQSGAGDKGLIDILFQKALSCLSREAQNILEALSLFTFLVHHEVLEQLTSLEKKQLNLALGELQWHGLVDSYDGDRYFSLHPRLQNSAARRLLTPVVYRRLAPGFIRAYRSLLAEMGSSLPSDLSAETLPALFAWDEEQLHSDHKVIRAMSRLGHERVNIAELAMIMAEEGKWKELVRLVEATKPFKDLKGMSGLIELLNRLLLEAGRIVNDENLQAAALNGLARPMMSDGQAKEAQPLLDKALRLLGDNPDWEVLAETYLLLSSCFEELDNREAAINILFSAIELALQLDDNLYLVQAVSGLVRNWVEGKEGSEQAERFLVQIINQFEEGGKDQPAAQMKSLLGDLYLSMGRHEKAQELYSYIILYFKKTGKIQEVYETMLRMVDFHLAENQPDDALDWFIQAQSNQGTLNNLNKENKALTGVCETFNQENRLQEALDGYLLLRGIKEKMGDRKGLISLLDIIGGLYFQLGEKAKSTRCYEESLQLQADMATP